MNEIIETTARTASTIAAEIRILDRQAADTCIRYIIEIGRRLVEAKALVGEGQWLQYIKTELNYEKSTAQNYMRLYERFGTGQASLYGNFAESQTFGSLTYTKALALLQVPEEDLEEFAEAHDIEAMSTRELKQAIRERDEAFKAQKDAQDRAERAEEQVERLTAAMNEAADKLDAKDDKYSVLEERLESAQKKEREAIAALEKAKAEPEIPAAMMEKLRAEAEAEGAKKARQEAQKELEEAGRQRQIAQDELRKTEEQLEEARKTARLGSPDAAVFKALFEQVQMDFKKLGESLGKVRQADPETGKKLSAAVKALLDKLGRDIGG